VIKLKRREPKISYLVYPDFDSDGHPSLAETFVVDLPKLRMYHRDYRESNNPPVLHRKETFVSVSYPNRAEFEQLTQAEETAGLLQLPETIGFSQQWAERLASLQYRVSGHELVKIRK
jgi:DNA phosphorothioation-associated putative methyltransferase